MLRLKDVARVEFGAPKSGFTLVDGKPAALIAITAWPGRVTADQFRQADVVEDLPPGVRFDVVADRSADRFLSVEVQLPPGSALGLTEPRVAQATELIRGLPGNPGTFGFTEGREPNAATIFVKVRTKGGPTAAEVGKALIRAKWGQDPGRRRASRRGGVPGSDRPDGPQRRIYGPERTW